MLLDLPIDLIVLLGFVPAALMLNLTPGADMMFCLAQGLKGGARGLGGLGRGRRWDSALCWPPRPGCSN